MKNGPAYIHGQLGRYITCIQNLIKKKKNYVFLKNTENNFQMSFCFHLPDRKSTTTYFAFCFPFSYDDCQNQLKKLDKEFEYCKNLNSKW